MELAPTSQRLKAFVIGPIGDRDADDGSEEKVAYEQGLEVLENIINPACKSLDIEAYRADHISRAGEIPEQVFRNLRDAHIVIADLTGANPNVMYELGLRHTTWKITIQIGEKERLPFDVAAIRTILFKRTEIGFIESKRSLIRALAEGLESGGDPVSATRVWFNVPQDSFLKNMDSSEIEEEIGDDDVPGFLELIADTESATHDISQTLVTGSLILDDITRVTEEGAEKLNSLPLTGNYSAAKLAVTNRIAMALEDPALRLKIVAQEYANHAKRATPGMLYLLGALVDSPEELERAGDAPEAIAGLVSAAAKQAEGADAFIEAFRVGGTATRSMRKVTNSIIRSSEVIRDASKLIASWKVDLDRVFEERNKKS